VTGAQKSVLILGLFYHFGFSGSDSKIRAASASWADVHRLSSSCTCTLPLQPKTSKSAVRSFIVLALKFLLGANAANTCLVWHFAPVLL